MNENISIITIMNGEKEFISLIIYNFIQLTKSKNNDQELELFVIDDGIDDLSESFKNIKDCTYIHLNKDDRLKFMEKILEDYKQPNKMELLYQKKINKLPDGFKRDYGCGISKHPYIFHMNHDCIYNSKSIDRKYKLLKKTGAECIFCDTILCYDIYNKDLYKSESNNKMYESTLFHTRDFWKRKGFQWSDIRNEGKYFHYNNGVDRKLDNYYDTVQLLSINNMHLYQPVKITLDNMKIHIPQLINDIKMEKHPFLKIIDGLYGKNNISILGLNSEFINSISENQYNIYTINEKWKQNKLTKQIQGFQVKFNILLFKTWRISEAGISPEIPIFLEIGENCGVSE